MKASVLLCCPNSPPMAMSSAGSCPLFPASISRYHDLLTLCTGKRVLTLWAQTSALMETMSILYIYYNPQIIDPPLLHFWDADFRPQMGGHLFGWYVQCKMKENGLK